MNTQPATLLYAVVLEACHVRYQARTIPVVQGKQVFKRCELYTLLVYLTTGYARFLK
jgi:hypothetical protein